MGGRWPVRSIAECAAAEPYSTQIGPFGKALMADQYTTSGVPVLRGVNVNRGRFHDDDFVFVDEQTANRLKKFESFPGDVLLVHKGTLGQIGLMPARRKYPRYIMGNSMMRVRCDPTKLLPEYLFYWLSSAAGQHYLHSRVSQVGVPQIQTPLRTLREARLPVPPLPEQRAIAHILGTLDDRIELNRRMNETLEAMARALFKSWFVDFDPVRAKSEGRDPGLPKPLANLFPSRLVDSALGEIPEGWEVGPLEGALILQRGFDLPASERTAGLYPVLAASGPSGTHDRFMVRGPGVTTGRSGVLGKVFFVAEDFWPLNTSLWVREFRRAKPAYAFHLLGRLHFTQFDAGSAVPTLNRNHVHTLPTLLPPPSLVDLFECFARGCLQRRWRIERQSRTLAALRDNLLPKLVSGELRLQLPVSRRADSE